MKRKNIAINAKYSLTNVRHRVASVGIKKPIPKRKKERKIKNR